MSRITIATDERGNVIGAIQETAKKPSGDAPRVGVNFAPGTRLNTISLTPDLDMAKVKDLRVFQDALRRNVPKQS